jgi:hypothetical protein
MASSSVNHRAPSTRCGFRKAASAGEAFVEHGAQPARWWWHRHHALCPGLELHRLGQAFGVHGLEAGILDHLAHSAMPRQRPWLGSRIFSKAL